MIGTPRVGGVTALAGLFLRIEAESAAIAGSIGPPEDSGSWRGVCHAPSGIFTDTRRAEADVEASRAIRPPPSRRPKMVEERTTEPIRRTGCARRAAIDRKVLGRAEGSEEGDRDEAMMGDLQLLYRHFINCGIEIGTLPSDRKGIHHIPRTQSFPGT